MRHLSILAAALLLAVPGLALADEPTIEELLDGVDDANRGSSSKGRMTMKVKTARWDRSMTMELASRGEEHSLVKIVSPAKEAGTATLRVEDNIWNYLPKVDRTLKVPAAMMSGAWMGSHFSNNDLVRGSRFADDYTFELTGRPTGPKEGEWVIACVPRPEAPVVWGKVIVKVRAIDRLPSEITYLDEDGSVVRVMTFSDFREVSGRPVSMNMKVVPTDAPQEYTEVIYEELVFDVDFPDSTFTLQALRK